MLAHLGAYLEALRQRPSGPGEGEAPGAWFEAMLTARGAQRRQVVQLNAALAAFLLQKLPQFLVVAPDVQRQPQL